MTKDLYKGFWNDFAGHNALGESYEEAVRRELKEELDIDVPLEKKFLIKKRIETESENMVLFEGKSNGPFKFNKDEFQYIKFFSLDEIEKMLKSGEKFTPGTRMFLEKYFEEVGKNG